MLTSTDDGAIEAALQSLLLATEADYAYVALNFDGPGDGALDRDRPRGKPTGDAGYRAR